MIFGTGESVSGMRPLRRWIWNWEGKGLDEGDGGGSVDSQRTDWSQVSRAGMADCERRGRWRVSVDIVCLVLVMRVQGGGGAYGVQVAVSFAVEVEILCRDAIVGVEI